MHWETQVSPFTPLPDGHKRPAVRTAPSLAIHSNFLSDLCSMISSISPDCIDKLFPFISSRHPSPTIGDLGISRHFRNSHAFAFYCISFPIIISSTDSSHSMRWPCPARRPILQSIRKAVGFGGFRNLLKFAPKHAMTASSRRRRGSPDRPDVGCPTVAGPRMPRVRCCPVSRDAARCRDGAGAEHLRPRCRREPPTPHKNLTHRPWYPEMFMTLLFFDAFGARRFVPRCSLDCLSIRD
jgi:hypothetical protein